MRGKHWAIGLMFLASCSGQRNSETTVTHPSVERDKDTGVPDGEEPVAEDEGGAPADDEEAADVDAELDAGPTTSDASAGDAGIGLEAASELDAGPETAEASALDAETDAAELDAETDAAELDATEPDSATADGSTSDASDASAGDAGRDAAPEAAANILINFEGLTGMPNSLVAVPAASQLSDRYFAETGAVFRSLAPFVAVVSLGQGHATSGTLGIGGTNADGQLSYGSPVEVAFFAPEDRTVQATTGYVKIRGDQLPATGIATLSAYDVHGTMIGSAQTNDVSGGLTLQLAVPSIHRVVITQTQANIALDDLEFQPVTAAH